MISSTELLRISESLQTALSNLYALVKSKEKYGRSFWVIGHTYEEAIAKYMKEAEQSLIDSGRIGLEIEIQNLFDRSLAKTSGN